MDKVKTLKQLVAAWVRYRKSGGEYVNLSDDVDRYWREQLGDLYEQFYTDVDLDVSVGLGWIKLYVEACRKMKAVIDANPTVQLKVVQVKQKFGGLRIYAQVPGEGATVDLVKKAINEIIKCAAEEADRTCEVCGDPGALVSGAGIRVSCSKHSRI